MKTTLLLSLTLIVSAMSIDEIERTAATLNLTREEVQACFNKTDITSGDITHFHTVVEDGLQPVNFDESALKMGCLIACLNHKKGLMTGARMNMNQLRAMTRTNDVTSDVFIKLNQALDTCVTQANSKTNECEVSATFVLCFANEMSS